MPRALVEYDRSQVAEPQLRVLGPILQSAVAESLGYPHPGNIRVIFKAYGSLDIFSRPLDITILAGDKSERRRLIDEGAADKIMEAVGTVFPADFQFSVWPLLGHGAFVQRQEMRTSQEWSLYFEIAVPDVEPWRRADIEWWDDLITEATFKELQAQSQNVRSTRTSSPLPQ